MKHCPRCQAFLESPQANGKRTCSNGSCDFVKLSDPTWYATLAQNPALWYTPAFNAFPPVLAHEYKRLRDLLQAGQTYGVMYQLKDVFEVQLKFPLLVGAACLWSQKLETLGPEQARLLFQLQAKNLSLGDWLKFAQTLCQYPPMDAQSLMKVLCAVTDLFTSQGLVHWRNSEIGHGAMGFDATPVFQHELHAKLEMLQTHFRSHAKDYGALELWGGEPAQLLRGAEQALASATGSLSMKFGSRQISLAPYLQWQDHSLYFFDTYILKSSQSLFLDYVHGQRQRLQDSELDARAKALRQRQQQWTQEVEHQQLQDAVSNPLYSASQAELLSQIEKEADYLEPSYLFGWLSQSLSAHEQGVFVLQMSSGMGKSTFARALDPMQLNKLKLPDCTVRGYYCNESYRSRADSFLSKLSDTLRKNDQGQTEVENFKHLPSPQPDSSQPQQDLVAMLSAYAQVYAQKWSQQKLLLIVDGLDEVSHQGAYRSLSSFLPTSEQLPQGVYLLVTCRQAGEISAATSQVLSQLQARATKTVTPQDPDNLKLLRRFIGQKSPFRQWQSHQETLLTLANQRFLYLRLLQVLLQSSSDLDLSVLPAQAALIPHYLEQLQRRGGQRYSVQILDLLITLAVAGDPMSLAELAWLLSEDLPTFGLLARLLDIRLFLKTERSPQGNLYTLVDEMQSYLQAAHPDQLQAKQYSLSKQAEKQLQHVPTPARPPEPADGNSWLVAHALSFIPWQEMLEADGAPQRLQQLAKQLFNWGFGLDRASHAYLLLRSITLYSACIQVSDALEAQGKLYDLNDLASAYMNRGLTYRILTRYADAIRDYDRCIPIWENLQIQGELHDINDLAKAYLNRGVTYRALTRYADAIRDYDRCIQIRKDLKAQDKLHDINSLARAYLNRGVAHRALNHYKKALRDVNRCLKIRKDLKTQDKLHDLNDLARAYLNRGVAHRALNHYQKALRDVNRCLKIRKDLKAQDKLHDLNDLATAYLSRGETYRELTFYEKSLSDVNQCLEIRENLQVQGELHDLNALATAYLSRGETYFALTRYEESLSDHVLCIQIWETLQVQGELHDLNNLGRAYLNRGIIYAKQGRYEAAMQDAHKANTWLPGSANKLLDSLASFTST